MSTTGGSTDCACAAAARDGLCPGKAEWQQTIDKSNLQAPPLTKQDAAFEKEGCQFVWGLNELTVEDLNSLFRKARNQVACHIASLHMSAPADAHLAEHANILLGPSLCHSLSPVINLRLMVWQVGFPQRDPARLKMALDNSHIVLWIRSMKQSRWARQGQLLGFARATSDGALNATIWDVAVRLLISYRVVYVAALHACKLHQVASKLPVVCVLRSLQQYWQYSFCSDVSTRED